MCNPFFEGKASFLRVVKLSMVVVVVVGGLRGVGVSSRLICRILSVFE